MGENRQRDSDGMSMEAMERMMSRLLSRETSSLATKQDVQIIREETQKNAERIDKVCKDVNDLRKQVQEVR